MTSSKSLPTVEDALGQLPTIVSTYKDEDTNRRRFSFQGIASPRSRLNKTCAVCGGTKNGRGAMCRACYHELRKIAVELQCDWCNKTFERPLYVHEKALRNDAQGTYCGRACLDAHNAVKNARRCATCGKPMPGQRSRQYCSRECWPSVVVREPRLCNWCQMEYQPKNCRAQFCTRECAAAAHSVRMRGKGNGRYKTGMSYAQWFRDMKPLIIERDDHRCVTCGQPEIIKAYTRQGQPAERTNLQVHHIDGDRSNNKPENLVTMCQSCHISHHGHDMKKWLWLGAYAQVACQSMTSKWLIATTSLQEAYLSTTAAL